jgi:GTPase SAR1 family protein
VWDVGGQDKIRPLAASLLQNTQGLIFVVVVTLTIDAARRIAGNSEGRATRAQFFWYSLASRDLPSAMKAPQK